MIWQIYLCNSSITNNYQFSGYNLVTSYFNLDQSYTRHMQAFFIEFVDIECRGYSYYKVGCWKIIIERDRAVADSSYKDLQTF
jgi:hypothetical protein